MRLSPETGMNSARAELSAGAEIIHVTTHGLLIVGHEPPLNNLSLGEIFKTSSRFEKKKI